MRSQRPSAQRARANIRNASVSSSESDLVSSERSETEESSPEKQKSERMSCCLLSTCLNFSVNSLDKYTYKKDANSTAEPWVSTIRGTATRLDSLKTVGGSKKKSAPKSKPLKKRVIDSESESDDFSSSDESILSSSHGSSSPVVQRKGVAKPISGKVGTKKSKGSSSDDYSGSSDSSVKNALSDDEFYSSEASSLETDVEEVNNLIVEKILAKRKCANSKSVHDSFFEYLVKWKCQSYSKCQWISGSELSVDVGSDKRSVKLKNFNNKHPWGPREESVAQFDGGYFYNPIFEQPERIIAVRNGDEYLVKWNGLSYSESTWERIRSADLSDPENAFGICFSDFVKLDQNAKFRTSVDSRKSSGRVLNKSADPTADFAKQLRAEKHEAGPLEYAYTPDGKSAEFRIFDFQKEGISWLLFNWSQGRGSMLADEMGLGKTVQTAVTLSQMERHSQLYNNGPLTFLIVAPLSTIEQWKREIRKWTNLEPIVYHGNRRDRNIIKKYEFANGGGSFNMPKFNVLISTFESVGNEADFFINSGFVWSVLVIDEAHKLKSNDGKARMSVLGIPTRHRILLTGTPIQNNVSELWNLLHLCSPHYWSDQAAFMAEFGDLKSVELTQKLQAKIEPYLLQRRKIDVLSHLVPAKEETIVSVELTRLQKETYRAVYEKNLSVLSGGTKNVPALTNIHMELRKCCNHPFLVNGVEERVHSKLSYPQLMESLISSSGKMVFLDKLLQKIIREKSKILIFSQFTMMLDLIEDYLRWKGYLFERLDGGVKTQQRQESIDRFNKEVDPNDTGNSSFVFLLSTKAGGVGLNLTAANYVLLFDHDWNPQNDLQAQARCHRIGQTREVMIFRLVTRGTYEEKMFQVASQKLGLEQAVMSSGGAGGGLKLTKEEMDKLLKEGAYAMLEDDENERKFCLEDVDEILQTRARVVVKGESTAPPSGFSRAKFQVNEDDIDIDVNDPNFWAKMAQIGQLVVPVKKNEDEYLDYQMRKGRATFGTAVAPRVARGSGDSSAGSSSDEEERVVTRGGRRPATRSSPADKLTVARTARMKLIYKFIMSFGLIENRQVFDERFRDASKLEVPAYSDMLTLIIALYVLAKPGATKFDEIHFSPVVRSALACLSRFVSTGETPEYGVDPICLDGMFPDMFVAISRCDISVPSTLLVQPVASYITDSIPKNRKFKNILSDLDSFNEIRFLMKNPHFIKPTDKAAPPNWTLENDLELLHQTLSFGKDSLLGYFEKEVPNFPPVWASVRVDRIVSRFSQARCIQLTFLVASFGFATSLMSSVLKSTGYPWTRKFACGESCLEMLHEGSTHEQSECVEIGHVAASVSDVASAPDVASATAVGDPAVGGSHSLRSCVAPIRVGVLLTPVQPPNLPDFKSDEASFGKFLLSHLPPDCPFTTLDISDYSKSLLFRVLSVLGRKSEKHEESIYSHLRPTRNNEVLFTLVNSVCWPSRSFTRMEAFKLMWRFQTLHFLRTGLAGTPGVGVDPNDTEFNVLGPIALSLGLDSWEIVTNLNRHLTLNQCLQSLISYVCTIQQQAIPPTIIPPKRKISTEPNTNVKSMKLTSFFTPTVDLTESSGAHSVDDNEQQQSASNSADDNPQQSATNSADDNQH